MQPVKLFLRGIMAAFLFAAAAITAPDVHADDPAFVSTGLGRFDIYDDFKSLDFRFEYRSSYKFLGIAKPWAGLESNADGALYTVAGVLTDLYFGRRIVLTPSVGIGIYAPHKSKDLGNEVEVRSQIELGYRFDDRSRLSFALSHISNADLSTSNPGTEIATIYYHVPVSRLFGSD